MANESLISAIEAVITDNDNNEITGQILQDLLTQNLVPTLGADRFKGVATPSTNPGTPESEVYYLATEQGTYANFSGLVIDFDGASLIFFSAGVWVLTPVLKSSDNIDDADQKKAAQMSVVKAVETKSEATYSTKDVGVNRFDKNAITSGYFINSDGVIIEHPSFCISGFIKTSENDELTRSAIASSNNYALYYDEDLKVIDSSQTNSLTMTGVADSEWMRVSMNLSEINDYMLVDGDTLPTEYSAYTETKRLDELTGEVAINEIAIQTANNTYVAKDVGVNKFNKDGDITEGYYISQYGTLLESENYIISGFIKTSESKVLRKNHDNTGAVYSLYYDANFKPISGSQSNGYLITGVADAEWVKVSVHVDNVDDYMLVEGSSLPSTYQAYTENNTVENEIDVNLQTANNTYVSKSIGVNKFNKNGDLTEGYYISSSGSILSNGNYIVSGFIKTTEGEVLRKSNDNLGNAYSMYYDANFEPIESSQSNGFTITGVAGAEWVKVSIHINNISKYMLVVGSSVPSTYHPYTEFYNAIFRNDIAFPSKIYHMNGVQSDIFIEPLIKRWKPYDYDVRFSGTVDYYRNLKEVASLYDSSDGKTIKLDLVNRDTFASEKTLEAVISSAEPSTGAGNISASIIGNSYTQGKFFEDALFTKAYVPNLDLIGLREVDDHDGYFDEGRGGWTLDDYFTVTTSAGVSYNGFFQPDTAEYWGSTGFWKLANDIRLGGGTSSEIYYAGRFEVQSLLFDATTGYKLSPSTGDLMYDNSLGGYVEYNGSSWVSASYGDYTWSFDYSKYLSMWGLSSPDILFVMLGLNDFRDENDPNNIDFSEWNAQMEFLKASYLSAVPSGKLAIIIPCSTVGTENNVNGYYTSKQNACMWEFRKNLIENFDDRDAEDIYLVDGGMYISNTSGYSLESWSRYTRPFKEYTGDDAYAVQTGQPHPYENYKTLGICVAAFIQNKR